MSELLDQLLATIPVPGHPEAATAAGTLAVTSKPEIFIPPPMRLLAGNVRDAGVVVVQAPAAVGKSTLVRQISAERRAPLLDLANVAAGANTLAGSLTALHPQAVNWFQAGELAILIDALDEAQVRAGQWHFEQFMETTARFLANTERSIPRLRLILFGRPPAVQAARFYFEVYASDAALAHLEIDFFDESTARDLVQMRFAFQKGGAVGGSAGARLAGSANQRGHPHAAAVDSVITTYFNALEASLNLQAVGLWQDQSARAFAGYAPVLDTLGYICAAHPNLAVLRNELAQEGFQHAWAVLERVLRNVTDREQNEKFMPTLGTSWSVVPPWAYDRDEQFRYISQFVRGAPCVLSGRGGGLPAPERQDYRNKIAVSVETHPFVRGKRFANDIFAAVVSAHHICEALTPASEIPQIDELSRTPFLWRCCRSYFERESTLIDGETLGYILASLWTDPLIGAVSVEIRDRADGGAAVTVGPAPNALGVGFGATFPLRFVQLIGCGTTCEVSGDIILAGVGQSTSFEVRHGVAIECEKLQLEAKLLRVNGASVSIAANRVEQPPDLEIIQGARQGEPPFAFSVGGALAETHPWSDVATERRRADGEVMDKWTALIERCAQRASAAGLPALTQNGDLADDSVAASWIRHQYENEFPRLVRALIQSELGNLERMQASGPLKYRLRINFIWQDLVRAARRPDRSAQHLRALIEQLRSS